MCFPLPLLLARTNNTALCCCSFGTSLCIYCTHHFIAAALALGHALTSNKALCCLIEKSHHHNVNLTPKPQHTFFNHR